MCGRYTLHSHPAAVALEFGLAREPEFAPRYNIAPAADVLVVRELVAEKREAATMRWGLVPPWAKDPAAGFINARLETAATKSAFREAFSKRRCLVPANGFYDWKAQAGRKQPYYIHAANGELFGIAGLYEVCRRGGEPLTTCTILTRPAVGAMRDIHDRMPAIIARADYGRWLAPGATEPRELCEFLTARSGTEVSIHPVSSRVNNARNDDPSLIEAADALL